MSKITKINVGGTDYDIGGSGGGGYELIEVTYAALKGLVDASELTPGNRYRITDFVSIFNDNVKSANHPFDLIVTANTENTFYPKAQAIKHEGDVYFANNDLSKWEIWYDFKNDTSKYAFANSSTGKGFIYRMIDENNNDVNYDFKNLLVTKSLHGFHSAFETNAGEAYFYTFSAAESNSPADLRNSQDLSTIEPANCCNNTIRMELSDQDPYANDDNGVILGIAKGFIFGYIKDNHIEGSCMAYCYNALAGNIQDNKVIGNFRIEVIAGYINGNTILNKTLEIGPQNWEESTYMITFNEISYNVVASDIFVYGQETSGLNFTYNNVRNTGRATGAIARIWQKASIKQCDIFGSFTENDSNEYPTITEAQEGKLIVGKGDTLAIIDPATFYTS